MIFSSVTAIRLKDILHSPDDIFFFTCHLLATIQIRMDVIDFNLFVFHLQHNGQMAGCSAAPVLGRRLCKSKNFYDRKNTNE